MGERQIRFSPDPWAWGVSAALLAVWLVFTLWMCRRRRHKGGSSALLVIHASQTGHAADLAERTQLRIEASGRSCALVEADRVTPDMLAQATDLFFVVSTTGEGEAPDNARRFERSLMAEGANLSGKRAAVLALGDRRYPAFCAFGRRVGVWVRQGGAEMLFPPVEVDVLARTDLAAWDTHLDRLGYAEPDRAEAGDGSRWRISHREKVAGPSRDRDGNLNSDGLYGIALRPVGEALPPWEIGDLFELRTPDGHVRDYSIANRPGGEEIRLFVRRVVDKGVVGRGSGYLTDGDVGAAVISGRIRSHRSFHPPTGEGPLLAIGAGSGWAGLRPHLLHAMALGQPCRLIFGEREAEAKGPLLGEMRRWQAEGRLDRLDLALSRGEGQGGHPAGPYVQQVVTEQGGAIAAFLGHAGRIVLCGRLAMGERSLAALTDILGEEWLEKAREEGRLRRDLY